MKMMMTTMMMMVMRRVRKRCMRARSEAMPEDAFRSEALTLWDQPQMTGENSTTDAQEILDNEDDRKSKRQRSQEPGGTMRGKPASS